MPTYRYIMFTNAVAGREDEFNKWYDDVHFPDIARAEAFSRGERYEIVPSSFTSTSAHRYAAIYDVDGEDAEAALQKLKVAFEAGQMLMSDAFDAQGAQPILLKSMGTRLQGKGSHE